MLCALVSVALTLLLALVSALALRAVILPMLEQRPPWPTREAWIAETQGAQRMAGMPVTPAAELGVAYDAMKREATTY